MYRNDQNGMIKRREFIIELYCNNPLADFEWLGFGNILLLI